MIDKEIVPWQKLAELISAGKQTQEDVEKLRKKHDVFIEELQHIASEHQEMEKETHELLQNLEQDAAKPTVQAQINALKKKYPDEKIKSYLDDVEENILYNLDHFKKEENDENKQPSLLPAPKQKTRDPFLDYKVNVVVDNSKTKGTPLIIETAPTFHNLFGVIERSWDPSGFWITDFTKIKSGSLLRANGGYLVFNLVDALAEPGVWKVLKRTLKNRQLIIQSIEALAGFATSALKPEPIDIDLKLLVIGDERT